MHQCYQSSKEILDLVQISMIDMTDQREVIDMSLSTFLAAEGSKWISAKMGHFAGHKAALLVF